MAARTRRRVVGFCAHRAASLRCGVFRARSARTPISRRLRGRSLAGHGDGLGSHRPGQGRGPPGRQAGARGRAGARSVDAGLGVHVPRQSLLEREAVQGSLPHADSPLPRRLRCKTLWESSMKVIWAALLSAILFHLSQGLADIWALAWFAPAPLLWLAYGDAPRWQVLLASLAAFAAGQIYLVQCYWERIPPAVIAPLALGLCVAFAIAVLVSRDA